MILKVLSLLFVMCFIAYPTKAQKTVTVKSFVQTTDHISSNERRKDLNGDFCALIKVYVIDDIERIEGNKIGDIVKLGNVEKWVYMCKGSRNIRIHLKNHFPIRVMFQDYHINGLESNRVYELYIEALDAPGQASAQTDTPVMPIVGQQNITTDTQSKHGTPIYSEANLSMNDSYKYSSPVTTQPSVRFTPPRPLNKSFKVDYEGVIFKCKAKKGYVTITGFDTNAENVTIPAKVEFQGEFYPVREVDTFINGNNYSAKRLVIEEGVESIANFAFIEFRKLVDVTIPNSINKIGKNAFRDKSGMRFTIPSNISEYDLRGGRTIKIK